MTLEVGKKLGPYEIISPAGAGGMGEIYKARDTRLDRTVAIKVLPPSTALNADMRARFEREAKSISSLNHPNICILHDIGHQDGIDYLVMEYIEGVSLSDRLKNGPLDEKEALTVAVQIADALDKAHRQGLVHRDLKPGNVMLTKQGAKLLDFGLAKLQNSGGGLDVAAAITQTTPLTGAGTLVGTIQYMAPEQLEGTEADSRSDIFSFGCLLYEMVTGHRAFSGKSHATLIAAIIGSEPPPVSDVKPMSAPGLNRVVKKCLAKDPDERWQSARDMADELRWVAQSGSQAGVSSAVAAKRRFKFRLAWVIAALALLSTLAVTYLYLMQPKTEVSTKRFTIEVDPSLVRGNWPQISPNGEYLTYLAVDSNNNEIIWVRPMNSLKAYALAGTEGANRPFWSPDSRYLGYTDNGKIKKIPVTGGPAQLLGEALGVADGSWGTGGVIVFDGRLADPIKAISATGGNVYAVTKIGKEKGETIHAWPQFLPDGKHFFYIAPIDSGVAGGNSRILVGSLDTTEAPVEVGMTSSMVRYTAQGYLLFVRDNILFAQKFDAKAFTLIGEPAAITDGIYAIGSAGGSSFSVSDEGTLVIKKNQQSVETELKWYDRSGAELGTVGPQGAYTDVSLSPDAKRLAVSIEDPTTNKNDLWIRDLQRDVATRLTFEPDFESMPVWTPDGSTIIYTSGDLPLTTGFMKAADGSSEARPIPWPDSGKFIITSIGNDGQTLAPTLLSNGLPRVATWSLASGSTPREIAASSTFNQYGAMISPSGRYVAYTSTESGKEEIYVRRYDGTGGKWQVSTQGGSKSRWRADGRELFYRQDNSIIAVSIREGEAFEAGTPKKLFDAPITSFGFGYERYDVTADGQKFIVVTTVGTQTRPSFEVTLNWTAELKEK